MLMLYNMDNLNQNITYQMQNPKVKRVFQLRKASARKPNPPQSRVLDQEEQPQFPTDAERIPQKQNTSMGEATQRYSPANTQNIIHDTQLTSHPEISVDQSQLHFREKIGNVQVKNLTIRNVGSSAIYFEWNFKNLSKLNQNAIKDPKPNFYCHYQPNVIKPGEEQIFSFSFFSETPGVFVQEVEILCQPQPATPIPPFRLKGVAYIEDSLQAHRQKLCNQHSQQSTQNYTKQVLSDIVSQVKSPEPPLPDVSKPSIAEKQFQCNNSNYRLYYNPQVHSWFNNLYNDLCNELQIPCEKRYWNQSVDTLGDMITKIKDAILQEWFDKRLQNYKSLSTTRPPQKSDLFHKVKDTLFQVGYLLGGTIVDQSKKQLEMWEIPFEELSETQTEQEAAAKKDQRTKIIAEWAKKMKKKKWGADEQKQMLNNYQMKLESKVSKALMDKFTGFDDQASFESCRAQIKQQINMQKYFGFLERFKTVQEFPVEGKKIFLKFDLKLKQNSHEALIKLEEYLHKKKEQELRAEEERKNQEANKTKKKAAPIKKKKGQKEEEQQKVLTFDFNTLLDHESWEGFVSTLRFILEKQPLLLVIGVSYGPKSGVFLEKSSIKFLLEPLKTIQPSIEFLEHKDLLTLKKKIQDETLNQGSLYLTQNLSFLPCEGMQKGQIKTIQKQQNGQKKHIETVQSQKMLMSQVDAELQQLMPAIDVIVREDRFVNRISGICSYGKKISILGLSWWKFIAFALRTRGSKILVGGGFSPQKLVLLHRLTKYCSEVYLAGELAVKFWMGVQGVDSFYGYTISKNEENFVKELAQQIKSQRNYEKLILPKDYLLCKKQDKSTTQNFQISHEIQKNDFQVSDIGQTTCKTINKITNGHFFIIDSPSISKQSLNSLQHILKSLAFKKQQKKLRHQQQQSSPAGINYQKDLVVYLIGINEADVEKISLKDKKIKEKEAEDEEQEEEADQEEQEEESKKIQKVCDFRLNDTQYFNGLLQAKFSYGLKDISKYPKSD